MPDSNDIDDKIKNLEFKIDKLSENFDKCVERQKKLNENSEKIKKSWERSIKYILFVVILEIITQASKYFFKT